MSARRDELPDEVDMRLERWGRLARGRYEGLGFSDRSILARLIVEGLEAAGITSDWAASHLPDDVVDTDQAVARLPPRYKRAIKVHYMTDLPSDQKAKILRTSLASYKLRVMAGRVGVCMSLGIPCG